MMFFLAFAHFTFAQSVTITTKSKLYEFFQNNFPKSEKSNLLESDFKMYLSSNNLINDKIFLWPISLSKTEKDAIIMIENYSFKEIGFNYDRFSFFCKKNEKWNKILEIRKEGESGKHVFIKDGVEYTSPDYKIERYVAGFNIFEDKFVIKEIFIGKSMYENIWIYSDKANNFELIDKVITLKNKSDIIYGFPGIILIIALLGASKPKKALIN
jgi:hypothetical protein